MAETLQQFINALTGLVRSITFVDVIDVAIVAYIIYKGLQLVVETRAQQLLKGIAIFTILYFIASWLGMTVMNFILGNILQIGILAMIVLFQPEVRRALEQIGRSNISGKLKLFGKNAGVESENIHTYASINEICRAMEECSQTRTGALVVIERETKLGEISDTGTTVDALISAQLLENIFYPKAPLHDGAAILTKTRIKSAGCFLPLSQNYEISKELGTRHRAALGISEVSDAVVVVVSEETGAISVAHSGHLDRWLNQEELKAMLRSCLIKEYPIKAKPGKAVTHDEEK